MELFGFDKKEVEGLIKRDLNVFRRENKAFDFVFDKLKSLKYYVSGKNIIIPDEDFYGKKKSKWKEGKSYHWIAVESGDVKFLIRKYGIHFTIFQKLEKRTKVEKKFKKLYPSGYRSDIKYGAFLFNTDTDLVTENEPDLKDDETFKSYAPYFGDYFRDGNDMIDLNRYINVLISHTRERMGSMWIVNREDEERLPKRIKVEDVFDGYESITNIEKFIFCCEELSHIEMELFAENDMLEKIKTFKVGDKFNDPYEREKNKITKIVTEVKDDYYHAVGIKTKKKFYDVYHLTHWCMDGIFPTEKSDKLSVREIEVLENHYKKIASKMFDETTDKSDLTHIKEAMTNMPQGFGKTWLFAYLIGQEKENKK